MERLVSGILGILMYIRSFTYSNYHILGGGGTSEEIGGPILMKFGMVPPISFSILSDSPRDFQPKCHPKKPDM